MRARPWLAVAGSVLALSGCFTLKSVTSNETGCNPDEINISNKQESFGVRRWNAYCQGRMHACSWYSTGPDTSQVTCRPLESATKPGACTVDTQCKGDRICVSGNCVDPPARE